jgi:hypothetical protein
VSGDTGYSDSLRLTFAYCDDEVQLVRVQRITAHALAPFTPPPDADSVGHWVEIRDGDHRLLYHRPLHDPTRGSLESFGDAPGDELRRVSNPARSGEFQVRVPDLPSAHDLLLCWRAGDGASPGSVVPLVEQDFAELRAAADSPPDHGPNGEPHG